MDTPISQMISPGDAAEKLGMSRSGVHKICAREGIGQIDGSGRRLLSPSDLDRVKAGAKTAGNPLFGKDFGNGKGKPNKRLRRSDKKSRKK